MSKEQINLKAKDGVDISAVSCSLNKESVKAVVVVSHGFGEHAGRYDEFAGRLEEAGYASVILTQRGHGNLSKDLEKRKKLQGIIPSYQSFLDDIETATIYIKKKSPDTPIVLYGHSMGGNIAINYLLSYRQSDFVCAILESPWLGLHNEVSPFDAAMARLLGSISPNIAIIKELALSDITSDKAKADAIKNDPLYQNRISLRMFSGIKSGCIYALRNAAKISIPIFLAFAKYDTIVSNEVIMEFAKKCGRNMTTKEYESCHSIHNDVKRDEYYCDLVTFLNNQLAVLEGTDLSMQRQ